MLSWLTHLNKFGFDLIHTFWEKKNISDFGSAPFFARTFKNRYLKIKIFKSSKFFHKKGIIILFGMMKQTKWI